MKQYFLIYTVLILVTYMGCQSVNAVKNGNPKHHDKLLISYEQDIKPLISNNCLTCHSGVTPSANLILNGYNHVIDAIKNRGLLARINDLKNPMPMGGLMDRQERLLIEQWAKNGYLEYAPKMSSMKDSLVYEFDPPTIKTINIEDEGLEFFTQIQGHWVGKMFLLGEQLPWFAFDFRAINSSQVHGLFEGGSMGNLFNTFFVANYKGVKTIMLRNGGILNGIYRTSYFVLTKVQNNEYFFEDAYGGQQIMWVKVSFHNGKMKILTYTSKLGDKKPSKHMEFEGINVNAELAEKAAQKHHYPSYDIVKSFPNGMPLPNWGERYPVVTSATYLMQAGAIMDYTTLGKLAKDPIQITEIDNIATLKLNFERNDLSKAQKISVYLSREPLTDEQGKMKLEHGYISEKAMNQIILFPEISSKDTSFTMNYLHEGRCYITFVVDNNKDLIPSKGDYYSLSRELILNARESTVLNVNDIVNTI